MDTKSQCQYSESSMLAREALKQFWDNNMDNSKITVICPKCGKTPKVTITPKGEETRVLCECKYIISGEKNFWRAYEEKDLFRLNDSTKPSFETD
ncbi:MAG: hypothetical protein K2H41_10235 [Acetatifactor sp.]|nr:hypothetical protein [Acetatifactor sp.]